MVSFLFIKRRRCLQEDSVNEIGVRFSSGGLVGCAVSCRPVARNVYDNLRGDGGSGSTLGVQRQGGRERMDIFRRVWAPGIRGCIPRK